jgi:hypothetical protein
MQGLAGPVMAPHKDKLPCGDQKLGGTEKQSQLVVGAVTDPQHVHHKWCTLQTLQLVAVFITGHGHFIHYIIILSSH